jgi:hypothetical protein
VENAKGVSTRDRCFLPEILDRIDSEPASFWHQIWLALTADSLKCLIFSKFKKDIALRLKMPPDDVENVPACIRWHLLGRLMPAMWTRSELIETAAPPSALTVSKLCERRAEFVRKRDAPL